MNGKTEDSRGCPDGPRPPVHNDFVVASVGGLGGLLATRILADVLTRAGAEVKTSEVHGMAQRGGSVMSFVRRGRSPGTGAFAPVVDSRAADALLGLELLEAVRALEYLKPGGLVVANAQRVMPVPVITGQSRYPGDLTDRLRAYAGRLVLVAAGDIAADLGSGRVANVVCLGALAACLELDLDLWRKAIAEAVPPRTVDLNMAAFSRGVGAAEGE